MAPGIRDVATISGRMLSVGGCVAWERIARTRSRSALRIPPRADAISAEWLSVAICGSHPGAQVTHVGIDRPSSGTSSRAALTVSYNDLGQAAGLPTALFVKSTATWKQRLLLGLGDMIHRESVFFNRVRPLVEMQAPIGYLAAYDPRSWRSVCLMEDIATTRGAEFLEPTSRISRESMDGLLATLATLHGTFWESPHFDGSLAVLTTPEHFKAKISALITMRERSVSGARRAGELIPSALVSRQEDLWAAYGHSFEQLSRSPMTVLHGDSHIGNTYAAADGTMGFADWQVTSKGGWSYDVAYTMATGLTIEDRRAWEEPLLRGYLERLADAGGPALAFDDAWLAYRRSVPHAYFAWVFALGQTRLQPAMQPTDVSREMIARTAAALADLDTLGAWER